MRSESWRRLPGTLVLGLFLTLVIACGVPEAEPPRGVSVQVTGLESAPTSPFAPVATETGLISLSIDGVGTNGGTGTLQVQKPAGSTVRRAFLAATSTGLTKRKLINGDVRLEGQAVNWSLSVQNNISSWNHWAEVTSLVRGKLDAAPVGRVSLSVSELGPTGIEGEILAVIFDDPNAPISTVILLFGTHQAQGHTLDVALADSFTPGVEGRSIDLSLGISFGYQSGAETEAQRSLVEVNGTRLTSMAGGQDDGESLNGALLTVGGLDDTPANPAPFQSGPGPRQDDELYDLRPFLTEGSTRFSLFTQNPSNNDNIFFGALHFVSGAAVIGEGSVLGPVEAMNKAGRFHTVTATLQDGTHQPLVGQTVTFQVTRGPNKGLSGQALTDASGRASFTYRGAGGEGRDQLQASFVRSDGQKAFSNIAVMTWTTPDRPPVASCRELFLETDATCGASGSIDQGSFDPDGDLVGCTQSPEGPLGPGTTTVTLTCTDQMGLSSSCSALARVVDRSAPSLTCPANQTAECVNGRALVEVEQAIASDNCGVPTVNTLAPSLYALGENLVTQSATDTSGNGASCTSTITVQDTLAPVVSLHGESSLTILCGRATYEESGASALDGCFGDLSASLVRSGSVNTRVPGTYTLDYSVADPAGQVATATRVVQVLDNPAGCHQPAWTSTGNLLYSRGLHASIRLLDGRVLTAGGWVWATELYEPDSGSWHASGPLSMPRRDFTLTLLSDGGVLAVGGAAGEAEPSVELYNPATGAWSPTGSMAVGRKQHTATRLADGRVLVVGGASNPEGSTAELYDPSTGTWHRTGSSSTARRLHTATLLPDGTVLVAGGIGPDGLPLASAELYEPASGTWRPVADLKVARHDSTATLLADGRVLLAGGSRSSWLASSAELYDPVSGTWTSTGPMNQPRSFHTATLLPSGRVLVAGGYDAMTGIQRAAELYDPASGTWKAMPPMHHTRYRHTATLLRDGRLLLAGGLNNTNQAAAELFDSDEL